MFGGITLQNIKTDDKVNRRIIKMLAAVFFAGVFIGALTGNFSGGGKLEEFINLFFGEASAFSSGKSAVFYESLLKYGKMIIIMWFLGFVSAGMFFEFLCLFIKGIGYGFTSAFIIKSFGFKGIVYCLTLYFPQSIILIPVYFFIAFYSIRYIIDNINYGSRNCKKTRHKKENISLREHFLVLTGAALFVLIASLIDVFITPFLFSLVSF